MRPLRTTIELSLAALGNTVSAFTALSMSRRVYVAPVEWMKLDSGLSRRSEALRPDFCVSMTIEALMSLFTA